MQYSHSPLDGAIIYIMPSCICLSQYHKSQIALEGLHNPYNLQHLLSLDPQNKIREKKLKKHVMYKRKRRDIKESILAGITRWTEMRDRWIDGWMEKGMDG